MLGPCESSGFSLFFRGFSVVFSQLGFPFDPRKAYLLAGDLKTDSPHMCIYIEYVYMCLLVWFEMPAFGLMLTPDE